MKTLQRQYLETDLLPRFGATFGPNALVLNIGAGGQAYREYFPCEVRTSDIADGCDERFHAESIPYNDDTVDGLVFNGVFERLNDPMQAVRELYRVLKPGRTLLFGAPGMDFEWHADKDRWRLTPGGAMYVLRAFRVLEERWFARVYFLAVLEKAGLS